MVLATKRPDADIPKVVLADGRLWVNGWETGAPEIVGYFQEQVQAGKEADFPALLEQVLAAGVVAIRAVSVAVNVDYIEKEFERLRTRLNADLEQQATAIKTALDGSLGPKSGTLAKVLDEYLGQGGKLSDLFDPQRKDSALSRIDTILAAHLDGEGSKLRQLLDPTNSQSPLRQWTKAVEKALKDLRQQIESYHTEAERRLAAEQGRAEEREKGTLKGREYQMVVFHAVNEIAKVFGDSAEFTGDSPEPGGRRKKGDIMVTINPRDSSGVPLRIVFESKDQPTSVAEMHRELEDAKANRNAVVAVGVYSREEYMPPGTAPFREDGTTGYLCLHDKDAPEDRLILAFVYRAARFSALQTLRPEPAEVDTAAIRRDLEDAHKLLATFRTIKGKLTQVRSSVEQGISDAQEQLDSLRGKLSELFDRIDSRMSVVSTDGRQRAH